MNGRSLRESWGRRRCWEAWCHSLVHGHCVYSESKRRTEEKCNKMIKEKEKRKKKKKIEEKRKQGYGLATIVGRVKVSFDLSLEVRVVKYSMCIVTSVCGARFPKLIWSISPLTEKEEERQLLLVSHPSLLPAYLSP